MSKSRQKNTPGKSPIWMLGILGLLLAIMLGACTTTQPATQSDVVTAELPKEVSVSEAFDLRESGAFILDVREPEEWQEYHIPDSTLIPLGQLQSRVDELPRDQEIVVVCRSGNRSQAGRDLLIQAGFDQVASMAGGLKEWSSTGYPTVSGD